MSDPIAFRVLNEIGIIDQLGTTMFERSLPHGLTVPQFIVLNHFVRLGGDRSPVELADILQVTKATMTSTLQRLEAKGFVSLTPDPDDGRSKRVAITAKGRTARASSIKAIAHHLAELETAIGTSKLEAVLALLSKLRSFLDERRGTD